MASCIMIFGILLLWIVGDISARETSYHQHDEEDHSLSVFVANETNMKLSCGSDIPLTYKALRNITGYEKTRRVRKIAIQLSEMAGELVKLTMLNNRRRSFADLKCHGDHCSIGLNARREMFVSTEFQLVYCTPSGGRVQTNFQFIFRPPVLESFQVNSQTATRQYVFRCRSYDCEKDRLESDMELQLEPHQHDEAIEIDTKKGRIILNGLQPNENYTLKLRYKSQDEYRWSPWSMNEFQTAPEELTILGYDPDNGIPYVKYDHWIKKSLPNARNLIKKWEAQEDYPKENSELSCIDLLFDDEKFIVTWKEPQKYLWPKSILRLLWSDVSQTPGNGMFLSSYTDVHLIDGVNYFIKDTSGGTSISNLTFGYSLMTDAVPDTLPVIHRLSGTYFPESLSIFQIFDVRMANITFNSGQINWRIRQANDQPRNNRLLNWMVNLSPSNAQIPISSKEMGMVGRRTGLSYQAEIDNLRGCTDYSLTIQNSGIKSCPIVFITDNPPFLVENLQGRAKDREIDLSWSLLEDNNCIYEGAYYRLTSNGQLIANQIDYKLRSYHITNLSRNSHYNITLSACYQGICNDSELRTRTTVSNLDNVAIDYVILGDTNSVLCSISENVDFFVYIVEDSLGNLLEHRTQDTCDFGGECGFTPKRITISLQVGVRMVNGSQLLSKPIPVFVGDVKISWTKISAILSSLCILIIVGLIWLYKDIRKRMTWRRTKLRARVVLPEALNDIVDRSDVSQRMLK